MSFIPTSPDLLFKEIIYNKRAGLFYSFIRLILLPLSWVFYSIVQLRRFAYTKGIFSRYSPQVFTICVGNITAGGTGKTPFTVYLANQIASISPTAVISRGYKSEIEHSGVIYDVEDTLNLSSKVIGDEAVLLRRSIKDARIIIGKDRKNAIQYAESKGAQCIILDDGMQHFAVKPDIQIVLINAEDPFGGGHLLPRGLLREPISSLQYADLIVLTRCDLVKNVRSIKEKIALYCNSPVICTSFVLKGFFDLKGTQVFPEKSLPIGLFCGIAHPQQFVSSIEKMGLNVIGTRFSQDHVGLSKKALCEFVETCKRKGAQAIVCTEKDIVRISKNSVLSLPLYWVKGQIEIIDGNDVFQASLNEWKKAIINKTMHH